MTPAETATILRQLHDWLKGGTQWAPTRGAEAVKTAIDLLDRLEAAEKERDALRSKNHQYEVRLRKILEEPENTMSNGKAMREMLRQARLALGE